MTIAACYVSHEGVVLGADSTTTYFMADGSTRHLDNAQKILEIGERGSSLGIASWGRGGLPEKSFRQLSAELSDGMLNAKPKSVEDAADRFVGMLWPEYQRQLKPYIDEFNKLKAVVPRSADQEKQMRLHWHALFAGFCIGGHVECDRTPRAYEILFMPGELSPPRPVSITQNEPIFWGMPNMMERLLKGVDTMIYHGIRTSPNWNGTVKDLDDIIEPHRLDARMQLPLREAIDWIYSSIFITVKAMKFYREQPYCGGPIEVAAITADREFRWVRHKGLDQALSDHATHGGNWDAILIRP